MSENQQIEWKSTGEQALRRAPLSRLLLDKQERHWDAAPVTGSSLRDLSSQSLAYFRTLAERSGRIANFFLAESEAALIDKLGLRHGDSLKRAALLLFGKAPERLAPGAFLEIRCFSADGELCNHDEVHGDLFTQIDRGFDLLRTKYLKPSISHLGPERIETPPVPARALHEALVNAIAHKDYTAEHPVQVSVYPDRIQIWNPGHLPAGWSLVDLAAQHPFYPRNPAIADVLFRAAYLEGWGRGIALIRCACQEHGCPAPQFCCDNGLSVELGLVDVEADATPLVECLLDVLSGEMSELAIMAALNLQDCTSFRGRYLSPALGAGLIAMTLPDEPSSHLRRYRLTAKGEAHLTARRLTGGRATK